MMLERKEALSLWPYFYSIKIQWLVCMQIAKRRMHDFIRSTFNILFIFSTLISLKITSSAPADDLITDLPGIKISLLSFKQYSGYFTVGGTRHLHYWFVESQGAPLTDPVIIWLNGGPGCSSMEGMLSENGPFMVKANSSLTYNKYSWNVRANMLYIETPAGVGFSYNDTKYVPDDNNVAADNYEALLDFYKKFPEHKSIPLYLSGESYAGVYIPLLAQKIIHGDKSINFKGIAIGNGLYSYDINDNSVILFAYYHGLVGERLWTNVVKNCCKKEISRSACNFTDYDNMKCFFKVGEVKYTLQHVKLNSYDLYDTCYNPSVVFAMENLLRNFSTTPLQEKLKFVPPCVNSTAKIEYLNRADVRKALHIPEKVQKWELCSRTVLDSYNREYFNLKSVFDDLLKHSKIKVLLYSGDTDLAVNFLGTEWFVSDLKLDPIRPRQPWYVDGQVAGFKDEYKRLSFLIVKGAGHMVPTSKPKFSYFMLKEFIDTP